MDQQSRLVDQRSNHSGTVQAQDLPLRDVKAATQFFTTCTHLLIILILGNKLTPTTETRLEFDKFIVTVDNL